MKSIIPQGDTDTCYLCGAWATDTHHCLHGSYRKQADADGLTVHLCRHCHTLLHDHGVADKFLQQIAQLSWEQKYGTRDEFMKRYGRSFIV